MLMTAPDTNQAFNTTEEIVREYYDLPEVREAVLSDAEGRFVAFRLGEFGGKTVWRRNYTTDETAFLFPHREPDSSGPRISIQERGIHEPAYPCYLEYFLNLDNTGYPLLEVHAGVEKMEEPGVTTRLVLDMDPYGTVTWEQTLIAAHSCWQILDRALPLKSLSARWTGHRSIHLVGELISPMGLEMLKTRCVRALVRAVPHYCRLKKPTQEVRPYIYLDLGSLKPSGTFRCLGSLHHTTGHPCVQILTLPALADFDPAEYTREKVLEVPSKIRGGA